MSRAGSQVMKIGRRGLEVGWVLLTRSIIWAILSSSSGQMSGQWEKPKYTYSVIISPLSSPNPAKLGDVYKIRTNEYLPLISPSVNTLPL